MTDAGVPFSPREILVEAARLIRHLLMPGHSAIIGSLTPDQVILSSPRKGVSLGRGTVSKAAADLLVERGFICEAPSGTFTMTDAGRAVAERMIGTGDEREMIAARSVPPVGAACKTKRLRPCDPTIKTNSTAPARAANSRIEVTGPDRVMGTTVLRDGSETVTVQINEAESPLAWLRKRRDRNGDPFIDATCYEAGERLRRDMTMARIMPRVTSRWSPVSGGNGGPAVATDAMVSARQRLDRALRAVDGDYAGILLDVCGFLKRIESVERERHWPPRSGKVVLKLALQRLAAHYGIKGEARGPENSQHIRSWHEEPTLKM